MPCIMRPEDKYVHKHAKHCFMCHKKFSDFSHLDKVRDHCHLSGKFRYTLCSTCNLTCAKRPPEIHLFFPGFSNYDSHFIIQKLYKFSSTEIKIIPKNTEKICPSQWVVFILKILINFCQNLWPLQCKT